MGSSSDGCGPRSQATGGPGRAGVGDDVLDVDAEALQHDGTGGALAEAVDPDAVVGVALPPERGGGLDRQHGYPGRQHRGAVVGSLGAA